jgi:AcrR family transcriptional regulator
MAKSEQERGRASRRQAILEAALTVFAEHGFEAARLDEVARRAGVAKGTLYLYFKDKEALFEELLHGAATPIIDRIAALADADLTFDEALATLFGFFATEVLGTHRKLLLRLVVAEGPRFPRIAELHHREVVSRVLPLIRKLAARALERGEIESDAVVRFPQLVAAPLLLAVVWDGLFGSVQPLDNRAFFSAHRELLTRKGRVP